MDIIFGLLCILTFTTFLIYINENWPAGLNLLYVFGSATILLGIWCFVPERPTIETIYDVQTDNTCSYIILQDGSMVNLTKYFGVKDITPQIKEITGTYGINAWYCPYVMYNGHRKYVMIPTEIEN